MDKQALMDSKTVVWAGLDYSMVRIIRPKDFGDPDAVFPAMPEQWNRLFLRECLDHLKTGLEKTVEVDVGGISERNKLATKDQLIFSPRPKDTLNDTHITRQDIAHAVQSYKLESTNGLGLVFIVDRFVKPASQGAVYVVFFDVATREILSAKRHVHPAGGAGFRNYWFGVIKSTVSSLGARSSPKISHPSPGKHPDQPWQH